MDKNSIVNYGFTTVQQAIKEHFIKEIKVRKNILMEW